MNTTLKIYRVESGQNGTLWRVQGDRQANRLDEIRQRVIRETEQYLSDPDSPSWPRAGHRPSMAPAA